MIVLIMIKKKNNIDSKELLIKRLHDFQREININGMTTFYSNGLIFVSDFLKDIETFLKKNNNDKQN